LGSLVKQSYLRGMGKQGDLEKGPGTRAAIGVMINGGNWFQNWGWKSGEGEGEVRREKPGSNPWKKTSVLPTQPEGKEKRDRKKSKW